MKRLIAYRVLPSLAAFVNSLAKPHKIVLMVSAGNAIDLIIEQLLPLIDEGDIIIDAGNSNYLDTERRADYLIKKSIHFVGTGISGGRRRRTKWPFNYARGKQRKLYGITVLSLKPLPRRIRMDYPACAYIGPGWLGSFC